MSDSYNYRSAYQADKYVFKRFRGILSHTALHIYRSLSFLEESQGKGFCKTFIATYRDIERASAVSKNSVKQGLLELFEKGLVKVKIGSPVKDDKIATVITRVSIDELRQRKASPDEAGVAQMLADALNKQSFMYNGKNVQPIWEAKHTGRVCSAKPNFQGDNENKRLEGLQGGLKPGQVLLYADIKSADPTVIKHLLGQPQELDLYGRYMNAAVCDKKEAKNKVNMLSYCPDSLKIFHHWPEKARNDPILVEYVNKLHAYKTKLFAEAKKNRYVTTMTGRRIYAEEGKRLHAGVVLCWRVQGTVADIVNGVALDLIRRPEVKLVLPVHDALYVVALTDADLRIGEQLIQSARQLGITINVKEERHDANSAKTPPASRKA